MHDDQLDIDTDLVRGLVAGQFPQWSDLAVEAVPSGGTVNAIFRLGEDLTARFPLRPSDVVAGHVDLVAEAAAADAFARVSPFPAPLPVAIGRPDETYPLPWSVQTWLAGTDAATVPSRELQSPSLIDDLADLVLAFRDAPVAAAAGRGPGWRGGDLRQKDDWVQECLGRSGHLVDVPRLRVLWSELRDLPRAGPDVLGHGDLVPGNILVGDGRLTGVLDTGGFGPGSAPPSRVVAVDELLPRARSWAETMTGHVGDRIVRAHRDSAAQIDIPALLDREAREAHERTTLRPGAALARGAGNRARAEEPDTERTCFERDRDRIVHSAAFRRLAGKTQVVVYPTDHQRTRLTHALEVAQVATSIARGAGVNVTLTDAIALGHDCGHGPGGHASEDAFDAFLSEGYDHGPWGADVVLTPLNLCSETLDGIRNHSWSRPAPATVEGEIVSWADRIAYCAHDLEDATHVGIISAEELPAEIADVCGRTRRDQIRTFVRSIITTIADHGEVAMGAPEAAALAALRAFNYERIYTRPESVAQAKAVVAVLRPLVEYYAAHPDQIGDPCDAAPDSLGAVRAAVAWVGGMTDRYAFDTAVSVLDYPSDKLPKGIDRG